jgi:flagellar basal-body rod protein FlgF
MGLMESAVALISVADRQLEVTAQNVSNMATPGYRSHDSFLTFVNSVRSDDAFAPQVAIDTNFSKGKISITSNPYDLALGGDGFFVVKSGDDTRYTRNGHFVRNADGRLITQDGFALQADGGDLVLRGSDIKVLADGTVLDGGEPVARLVVADFADRGRLTASSGSQFVASEQDPIDVERVDIRQGAVETSNVSNAHEMLTMMMAMRQAESGQRLVQVYDELMGQAISGFGSAQG